MGCRLCGTYRNLLIYSSRGPQLFILRLDILSLQLIILPNGQKLHLDKTILPILPLGLSLKTLSEGLDVKEVLLVIRGDILWAALLQLWLGSSWFSTIRAALIICKTRALWEYFHKILERGFTKYFMLTEMIGIKGCLPSFRLTKQLLINYISMPPSSWFMGTKLLYLWNSLYLASILHMLHRSLMRNQLRNGWHS